MFVPKYDRMQAEIGKHSHLFWLELPKKGRRAVTTRIARLFTDHPQTVGETYFGHMAFAAWFSSRLLMAAGAALVHAFLPFMFETTASRIVRELYERTSKRAAH